MSRTQHAARRNSVSSALARDRLGVPAPPVVRVVALPR